MNVEGPRRAGGGEPVGGVDRHAPRNEGDPSVVLEGGDSRPIDPTRGASSRADGGDLGRVAGAMAWLCDPLSMQRYAQSLMRDTQVAQQEQGIEIQDERAEEAAVARAEALAESISKAEEAKGWGVFAQVAVRVAAVISAVALTVAGAFTGGAGVALAVGLIILAFGADLGLALQEAGVDSDVTNAIGIGASVIGTAFTFGGTAAGAVAAAGAQATAVAAKTAADVAVNVAKGLEIAARVAAGAGTITQGAYQYVADDRLADSQAADVEVTGALDNQDELVEDAIAFMESYARVVTRLTTAAEARDEALAIASRRLA
jgi:hypothetical protein